jgi:hypothetical protein
MENEKWAAIEGFNGEYKISNLGRIKSYKMKNPKIMAIRHNENGYCTIALYKNAKGYNFKIHRLVAMAFIPNPKNKEQVNHKDGNKDNNKEYNLEWCTRSENEIHSFRVLKQKHNMRGKTGEKHPNVKKIEQIDIKTGNTVNVFYGSLEAQRHIQTVNQSNIIACCKGKRNQAGGYGWRYHV